MRTTPPTDHDRRRLRITWRVFMTGVVIGIIGAIILGVLGLDGRAGFATVALGSALGCVVAGLTTAIVAIIDEARRQPVATQRVGVTLALFAVGGSLLLVVFALAGAGS